MPFSLGIKTKSNNDRYIQMTATRDGVCTECEDDIIEGDLMFWDTQEYKAYCHTCGKELK